MTISEAFLRAIVLRLAILVALELAVRLPDQRHNDESIGNVRLYQR